MYTTLIKNRKGFTLTELIIILGIFAILIGFMTLNMTGVQQQNYIDATVSILISDLKQQQSKAMTGNTEGRTDNDNYGIHFENSRYILFHGSSYSPSDNSNFVINLENNTMFTNILFPNSNIIFLKGNGEVSGFVPGQETITINHPASSQQKTIKLNKMGAITEIN